MCKIKSLIFFIPLQLLFPIVANAEAPTLEERVAVLEKKVAALEETKRSVPLVTSTAPVTKSKVTIDSFSGSEDEFKSLTVLARGVPYFKNGRSIGLRLFAIRSDSLLKKWGLQNGDIVTLINGKSIAEESDLGMGLFKGLGGETSIQSITVLRGIEEVTIVAKAEEKKELK